jgi:hypothetical protein
VWVTVSTGSLGLNGHLVVVNELWMPEDIVNAVATAKRKISFSKKPAILNVV